MNTSIKIKYTVRTVTIWPIVQGCILMPGGAKNIPRYPGTSWIATASANVAAKTGGLDRDFWPRGSSGWVQVPGGLEAGWYLEHGSKDRKGRRDDAYYRILRVTDTEIIVRAAGKPPVSPVNVSKEIALVWPTETCLPRKPLGKSAVALVRVIMRNADRRIKLAVASAARAEMGIGAQAESEAA